MLFVLAEDVNLFSFFFVLFAGLNGADTPVEGSGAVGVLCPILAVCGCLQPASEFGENRMYSVAHADNLFIGDHGNSVRGKLRRKYV